MKAVTFEVNNTYNGTGEVKGIDFTLIRREGNLCIFKRSDDWYEVATLKNVKYRERTINGVLITSQAGENYPQGDGWNGKMVKTLDRANSLFEESLLNKNTKWNFEKSI